VKAALAGLAAALLAGQPLPNRLPPIDQCSADAGFAAFRTQLERVVAAADAKGLTAMVADDVLVDFGGGEGKAAFIKAWGLDQPQPSQLWDELRQVMALGCAKEGQGFVIPSLGAQLPEKLDPFTTLVALPGSKLRKAPGDGAPSIASLDWNVLTVTSSTDVAPWSGVTMADGRQGFVNGEQVISPLGYRASFERRGGKWLLVSFVAGD
jgi:hypothetical protein